MAKKYPEFLIKGIHNSDNTERLATALATTTSYFIFSLKKDSALSLTIVTLLRFNSETIYF